jgi:hypothetical protein
MEKNPVVASSQTCKPMHMFPLAAKRKFEKKAKHADKKRDEVWEIKEMEEPGEHVQKHLDS